MWDNSSIQDISLSWDELEPGIKYQVVVKPDTGVLKGTCKSIGTNIVVKKHHNTLEYLSINRVSNTLRKDEYASKYYWGYRYVG